MTDEKEKTKVAHPEGAIRLLDGSVIHGYPKGKGEVCDTNPDEELQLFIKNAHYLLVHARQIMSDSRLFLAPVPIKHGVTIAGAFAENAPLGVYIEWWLNYESGHIVNDEGEEELLYLLAGSLLSGCGWCRSVDSTGNTRKVNCRIHDLAREFGSLNNRYKAVKELYQAYSISEVLKVLQSEKK